jgi:diguanylate cyclase (GGDEF)-like protein/PAS domain S-box-containing protein
MHSISPPEFVPWTVLLLVAVCGSSICLLLYFGRKRRTDNGFFLAWIALGTVAAGWSMGTARGSAHLGEMLGYAAAGCAFLVSGIAAVRIAVERRLRDQLSARIRHLVESSADGMIVEQNLRILEVNAAFEHLSGKSRASLVGAPIDACGFPRGQLEDRAICRTTLRDTTGSDIPVEIVANRGDDAYAQKGLRIYAVRDIRPRLEQERQIVKLARTDHLTGLPNRAAFVDHLAHLLATPLNGLSVALVVIDLNGFKEVNDVHGHAAGDEVLRVLSLRMGKALLEGEFIARLGGDEFVVAALVPHSKAALDLAMRLEKPLFSSVQFEFAEAVCGGSLGVALYPEQASSATDLMNNADLAMYRAKQSQETNICFYVEAMDEAVRLRRRRSSDLRDAIRRGEFELHYQKQLDLASGAITGYEALMRWQHPEHGFVPPSEFIPLAEATGLIASFGEWVLRTACKEAAGWNNALTVAVNVSATQIYATDLAAIVHGILLETGLAPSRLQIEITETTLMKCPEQATHVLRRIKSLGVSIAIDDFGTGYSSLSTLRAFAFDRIKLDKSFVEDVERDSQARTVLLAVLALGKALSIPVLAEGVETEGQLEFLRQSGCERVQGNFFGNPAPTIESPQEQPAAIA